MATLLDSRNSSSEVFTCPSNKGIEIHSFCPITACPYHKDRLAYLFDVTVPTKCGLHEPELQGGPSLATLQKSDVKKVSATTLRTTYNLAMELVKSKLKLVNEVPDSTYCYNCGRVHCDTDPDDCKRTKKWANEVLSYYGLVPNAFRRALIWKLLRDNTLYIPRKLMERK